MSAAAPAADYRIDILAAFTTPPPPQDFVIPGLLAGTFGVLTAPGASYKSQLALQAAIGVACDHPAADTLGLGVGRHGKVVYVNLEDPRDEIKRRLHVLSSQFDLLTRQAINDNLEIHARVGVKTNILDEGTQAWLINVLHGARLGILDTYTRCHLLDENSNGDMSQVVGGFEAVSRATGAAFLVPHHASKGAVLSGQAGNQHAARGASAIVDNARFAGTLVKMDPDEAGRWMTEAGQPITGERASSLVRFSVPKQNYGAPVGDRWFECRQGGMLCPVTIVAAQDVGTNRKGTGRHAPAQY